MSLSYSTFISDSLTLLNIISDKSGNSILAVLFDSVVKISNLKYSDSNSTLLYTYQTQINIANIYLSNIPIDDSLIYMTH